MPVITMDEENPPNYDKTIKPLVSDKKIDSQLSKPGEYELTVDDTFTVKMYMLKKEKRFIIHDVPEKGLNYIEHSVEFRILSFNEDTELRKMAMTFDMTKKSHFLDIFMLDRLKIQRSLKAWTFDRDNPRLKLLHVGNILSDESYNQFMKLHPSIIKFLIEKMNSVLEYNM